MALISKILEGTLASGSTSISFTDADIPNSFIRIGSTDPDLMPVTMSLSGTTLTISYEAQSSAKGIVVNLVKAGVSVIDALTSTDANNALSANQGKVLKDALDALSAPTAAEVSYDNTVTGMTADDVQEAIDEVFQSVSDGKTLIAAAITDKGVETSASDSFATMANNIENISGSGGSATRYVLRLTGGSGSSSYTIPEDGYYLMIAGCSYNGSRSITLPSGIDPILSDNVYSDTRGVMWKIAYLESGDVVTIACSPSSWQSCNKMIIELKDIDLSNATLVSSLKTNDGTTTRPTLTDDTNYLIIGYALGRPGTTSYYTVTIPSGSTIPYVLDRKNTSEGCQAYITCDNSKYIPAFSMYGYDGGFSAVSTIKL